MNTDLIVEDTSSCSEVNAFRSNRRLPDWMLEVVKQLTTQFPVLFPRG